MTLLVHAEYVYKVAEQISLSEIYYSAYELLYECFLRVIHTYLTIALNRIICAETTIAQSHRIKLPGTEWGAPAQEIINILERV
jgi:hypothetical protein